MDYYCAETPMFYIDCIYDNIYTHSQMKNFDFFKIIFQLKNYLNNYKGIL